MTACELVPEAEQAPLLQAAGEMATQSGRVEDAVRLLDAASEAYARLGEERASALVAFPMAASLRALGRHREAIDRITAALDTIGPHTEFDPDVGRLNAVLGRMLLFTGDSARAAPAIESALAIGQALELPDVFGEALSNKAMLCDFAGRAEEARYLYAAAIDVGERYGLAEILARAQTNAGYLSMLWDLPDAARYLEAATAANRRRGDRYGESIGAGNLMTLHLFQGRWDECERMGEELLTHSRPGSEHCCYPLCHLYAARGEIDKMRQTLAGMTSWKDVDDSERRSAHDSCLVALRLLQGRPSDALEHGLRVLEPAAQSPGEMIESVRHCWPGTLEAALELGHLDDARHVVELLSGPPSGLIPPALRLQARRGRALLDAAEGRLDSVHEELSAVVAGFEQLAAPYWHAVSQADLAGWLIEQQRPGEAASLLDRRRPSRSSSSGRPGARPGPGARSCRRELDPRVIGMAEHQLPAGTVTMVFTDVEGSTRLAVELGEGWGDVLAAHHELLRGVWTAHDGVEVTTEGDAFFVAFASAARAVAACAAAQSAIGRHAWPRGVAVRVRMGMHTGEPRIRDDDYWGQDVHYAARVAAAANGGQVLLSAASAALAGTGVTVTSLGRHRLKDFPDPRELFALGPGPHPAPRTLNPLRTNLPSAPTPLVGRAAEVREIAAILTGEQRLVTVTGLGGIGKTRVALAVAERLVDELADGAFLVDLAERAVSDGVLEAIGGVLGARGGESVAAMLAGREVLIVLDNFEHVLDAAPAVGTVLADAPRLRVLVTSQAPLRLPGKRSIP